MAVLSQDAAQHMTHMTHMSESVSGWDTAGAVVLLLWAVSMWVAVAVLAYANRRPVQSWMYRLAVAVIGLGVIGQLGHFQEHVAQAGYWIGHPNSPAWMTPWGNGLAQGYGQIAPSKPTLGMEILHLVGNFIFLAGLVGIALFTRRALHTKARKYAKMGVWMQGIHGLEHVALTVSVALGAKQAIGLSTWFGTLDPGPGLWTYRIWWHFIANVIGTTIMVIALYHLWRERRQVREPFGLSHPDTATDAASERTPEASVHHGDQPVRSRDPKQPTAAQPR